MKNQLMALLVSLMLGVGSVPALADVDDLNAAGDDDDRASVLAGLATVEAVSRPAATQTQTGLVIEAVEGRDLCPQTLTRYDELWLARVGDREAGAMVMLRTGREVCRIGLIAQGNDPLDDAVLARLLAIGLDHARQAGALKAVVQTDPNRRIIYRTAAERGFQLSRVTQHGQQPQIEFYTNLYFDESQNNPA